MAARQVRALLMGGQACVFYGAAEFSRDADLLISPETDNLHRLQDALAARPLLKVAQQGAKHELEIALAEEERAERERDRRYWEPLRAELEQLRHA